MDLLKIFGNMYCLMILAAVIITVLIIIAYVKTYYHIKEISENTQGILSALNATIANQKEIIACLDDIRGRQFSQYNQFYYEHCAANNLGPHEWVFIGSDNIKSQFQCRKCGQIINVPNLKPKV